MEKDLLLKDKRISDDDLRHILFEFYNYCMDLDKEEIYILKNK